jgi:predicted flap endonuclease-1-like 5' DNA nuclease
MRVFLLAILVLVAAVLIWAFLKNAFTDNLVFGLALLAVGMCGYLIADFVFRNVRRSWENDQIMYKSEISTLKEDKNLLQKQLSSAIPQEEVDEMKKKLYLSEEENRKLNNEVLAQAGNLTATNTRLERLLLEYNKLKEETSVSTVYQSSELDNIKETLATTKSKLQDLVVENERLKSELSKKAPTKSAPVVVKQVETQPQAETPVKFLNENGKSEVPPTHRISSRSQSDQNVEKTIAKIAPNADADATANALTETNADEKIPQPPLILNSSDDLKVIEGIGPKIEMILKDAGIENWYQLAEVNLDNLKGILEKAGPRFRLNDPSTWAQQARLLSEGNYDEFKKLTDNLVGGKVAKS